MTDHPIIFSAPMVQALLAGRKTQTRRLLTKRNSHFDGGKWPNYLSEASFHWDRAWVDEGPSPAGNPGPYLKLPVDHLDEELINRVYAAVWPGDRLWVRESYQQWPPENLRAEADRPRLYRATDPEPPAMDIPSFAHHWQGKFRWRPSIHMPRWASRLTLTVTEVRLQRLQDISEADAREEGVDRQSRKVRQMWLFGADKAERDRIFLHACKWEFEDLWNSLHGPEAWDANPWVVALTFTVAHGNIDQIGGANG